MNYKTIRGTEYIDTRFYSWKIGKAWPTKNQERKELVVRKEMDKIYQEEKKVEQSEKKNNRK